MAFQPVPTYQDPVEVDPRTGKSQFSPTWLSWFLTLSNGGLSSTIQHNSLLGLQGGSSGQYFHLTSAQLASIPFRNTGAIVTITPGGSPYSFTNSNNYGMGIGVKGGTVTKIEYSRGAVTFFDTGAIAGMFELSPGDTLRVTYSVVPTMFGAPR